MCFFPTTAPMTSLPPQRLKEHADARRKIVVRKGAKLWLGGITRGILYLPSTRAAALGTCHRERCTPRNARVAGRDSRWESGVQAAPLAHGEARAYHAHTNSRPTSRPLYPDCPREPRMPAT